MTKGPGPGASIERVRRLIEKEANNKTQSASRSFRALLGSHFEVGAGLRGVRVAHREKAVKSFPIIIVLIQRLFWQTRSYKEIRTWGHRPEAKKGKLTPTGNEGLFFFFLGWGRAKW